MSQKINASLFRRVLRTSEWDSKYIEQNKEESSLLLYEDIEIRNYIGRIFELHDLFLMTCKIEHSTSKLIVSISFWDHFIYKKPSTIIKEDSHVENRKNLITKVVNNIVIIGLKNYRDRGVSITVKTKNLAKQFENSITKSKLNRLEYKNLVKKLRVFKNYPNSREVIQMAFIVVTNRNSSKLLAKALGYLVTGQKRRHSYILSFIKKLFSVLIVSKLSRIIGLRLLIAGRLNGFPRAKIRLLKIGSVPLQSFDASVHYSEEVAYTPNGTFGIKVWTCGKNSH